MADINGLNIAQISRGIGVRFYINPTVNADGTVDISAAGGLDAADHPDAVEIGYTQEGVTLARSTTQESLPVDQRTVDILNSLTGSEVHMRTSQLQIRNYEAVVLLNPGLTAMEGSGFSGVSDQAVQNITPVPVVAIAPTPNDVTKFQVMIIYAGYNVAEFSARLAKAYNVTPIDVKAQDAGRTDGKTFAYYETVAVEP